MLFNDCHGVLGATDSCQETTADCAANTANTCPGEYETQVIMCVFIQIMLSVILFLNPFKPEFTIVIFIHYKPRIAVAILDL